MGADTGLDPARIATEQDALHRHRLAREIYAVLTTQPASTSVRFGLFGEWGYGKTTIANWVADIARHDGHVVVWFNPWASPTLDAMWFGLANALHSELVNRGIELSAWREIKNLGARNWRSAGSATEINSLKGLSGLVNRVLRFDKADTEKLKAALG